MNQMLKTSIATALAISVALPAPAQERQSAQAVLGLPEAVASARSDQPRITAYESEARASEEAAVAARSLPDLQLSVGIANFPIRGDNAFSPVDDDMTMYTIGLMREQIRRSRREADAQRILADALVSRRQAGAEERNIRFEVMIAWINAVEARAKQKLLARMIADLRAGRKVLEAAISTGGSTPAMALQADAEIAVEEGQLADARRAESRARAELARWIGSAANSPLPDTLPDVEVPGGMMPPIDAHPEVQVALAQEEAARRQVTVAQQAQGRDLSWSVQLGIRPKYGEMVSASVSLPLQRNRRNRQDRLVAEATARADAARLRAEDARRDLEGRYRAAVADYEGSEAEIRRLERESVPALEAAFQAAEARFAGGGGTLNEPFVIVRRYVEVSLQGLEARARRGRAAAEILHVHGESGR
jgi:outer membrane protein TolC